MSMYLVLSLSNVIIDSVGPWVGGWWVGGQVVGGGLVSGLMVCEFNKTQEKIMFELVVRLILLYDFNFFSIFMIKKKYV